MRGDRIVKNYLNFEGLSHFLDNLMGLFVKTNDVITEDEIDEVCGSTASVGTSEDGVLLTDKTTGTIYRLYVNNGKLNMMEVN